MRIYSPSQTRTYSQCPMKRYLQYIEGVVPKRLGKPGIAAWMGTALAAGTAIHYQARMAGEPTDLPAVVDGCFRAFSEQGTRFQDAGGLVEEGALAALPSKMSKALAYYVANDPIPKDWRIVGVEHSFPEHGWARADILVETPWGMAVVDNKWKENLYVRQSETKAAARNRVFLDYEGDWSQFHYVWSVRKTYGACYTYYIALGELGPQPNVELRRFDVSEETLEWWERTARQLWKDMNEEDADQRETRMAAEHSTKYGLCEMYDACFRHRLDENLMTHSYITIKREKHAEKTEPGPQGPQ